MKTAIYLPNHLGDAVVASSIVGWIKKERESDQLILIGRKSLEGIFGNFPGSDLFVPVEKSKKGFLETVSALKRERPDACFVLPKSFSSALIARLSGIKTRIGYSTDNRGFLLTEKLDPKNRKSKPMRHYYFRLFKNHLKSPPPTEISFFVPEPDSRIAKILENETGYVAVDPGAAYGEAKMWEDDKWIELIQKTEKLTKTVLVGVRDLSGWERNFSGTINLSSKTKIGDIPFVLSKSSVLVSCDTGSMHLAAALGVSTVSLFGSSSPVWTAPWGKGKSTVIYKNLSCSPCFKKTCPNGEALCMKSISVEEVYQAVSDTLKVEV
ncbi:glycosyltransferase family 9 protein [candidate division WOR-3 bacterium]|nr:glycosyltransferase family 9 protein [candidate division WOR-3 bacterium]